ncbi:MAG: hypothetical protein M3Z23_02215 [Acidobacteriota bacterium]|nr:hypothetical protein [Acidobacteriota bacterium]
MDVEKTIEFILAQQAKTEANLAAVSANQAKSEKQILAIRKLIWAGMKMIVDIGQKQELLHEEMKELHVEVKELKESQRDTDVKFKQLMDVLLKQNKNGH